MSDEAKDLTRGLEYPFPIDEDSNNYKLFRPVGKEIEKVEGGIEYAERNSVVQTADSMDALSELAELVSLVPKADDCLNEFRSRTIAEFHLNTKRGTPSDILHTVSVVLDTRITELTYEDSEEAGLSTIGIPATSLSNLDIDETDFLEIIDKHAPAGYRIATVQLGTFEYQSVDDYNSAITEPEYGYDGLDVNGDPLEEGGTYAGLIN